MFVGDRGLAGTWRPRNSYLNGWAGAMHERSFMLAWIMMLGIPFLSSAVAPLHQLLLLRHLYGRFIEKHGRTPQSAGRTSPQADRAFASTNMMLGALPYLVPAFIIAYVAKHGS